MSKFTIWTDTHISPAIAKWLNEQFEVNAISFYKLNFHTETDHSIFMKAKENNVVFMTKDKDFINLLATFKAPPYIIFLKTGNISNAELKNILTRSFQRSLDLITEHNYHFIEITPNV
jgi:predicted nuclease of predicted toxin-antitoxin system